MADKNFTLSKNDYQSQEINTKPLDIVEEKDQNIPNILSQNPPKYIRKKYKFNKFLKTVKKGGYTSARLIAKSLGVDKDTVLSWTNHSRVKEALGMDIQSYVQTIKRNKDWKASAYLLDKIIDDKDKEEHSTDLKQLIIINTK